MIPNLSLAEPEVREPIAKLPASRVMSRTSISALEISATTISVRTPLSSLLMLRKIAGTNEVVVIVFVAVILLSQKLPLW